MNIENGPHASAATNRADIASGAVLIVDDDRDVREAFAELLAQAGLAACLAEDGGSALRLLDEGGFDLVVLDVNLPDMSGLDLCRRIKDAPQSPPVMLLSGVHRDGRAQARGLEIGADCYLIKPVESLVFLATVRALLRMRAAEMSLRRSEAQARDSRAQLAAILESAPDGIVTLDHEARITEFNPAAERILGYRRDEALGRALGDLIAASAGAADFGAPALTLFSASAGKAVQMTARRADGRTLAVELTLSAVRRSGPTFYVAIVRNVSERRRVDEELRASEERHRLISELTSDYAYLVRIEPDGRTVTEWVSGAFTRITGYSVAEVDALGGGFAIIHPDDRPLALERVVRMLNGRSDVSELRIVTRAGETRWIREHGRPVCEERTGRVVRLIGAAQDITERKRAENELQARACQQAAIAQLGHLATAGAPLEELRRVAMSSIADVLELECARIYDLDSDRAARRLRVIACNEAADRDLELATELEHPDCYALRAPEGVIVAMLDTDERFPAAQELRARGLVSGLSVVIDGTPLPFGVLSGYTRAARTFTHQDLHFLQGVASLLAQAIDRKRAEEAIRRINAELEQRVRRRTAELEAANRELEAFSYSVSHDLRAPLRGIRGFSRALRDECAATLDQTARSYLDMIDQDVRWMAELIDALLVLSRIGRQEINPCIVDLSALARETTSEIRRADPQREVEIVIAERMQISADPQLMRIAMQNLIDNAWKYSRKARPARIEIGERPAPDGALAANPGGPPPRIFFVRDNGVGFDMAYAGKLFAPFQRLHSRQEFEGTGIGLATVQRIIERHGGKIWAEAEPERGATFFFTLG